MSAETLVTTALLIASALFLMSALALPAGTFDPLGPGAAPEMVAGLLCVLCLIVLGKGFARDVLDHHQVQIEAVDIIKRSGAEQTGTLVGFLVLLISYLVAFELQLGHFIALTIPFMTATILLLAGFSLRVGLTGICLSVAMSTGLFYILTNFFVIRLPGI